MASIIAENDQGKVLPLLADACRSILPADAVFAAVYGDAMQPVEIFDDVRKRDRFDVIESYIAGAYLLDPFYRAGIDGKKPGLYRVTEVGPPGFEKSEYFKRYYQQSGISDEAGFLTYLPDGCFANFSLVRLDGSQNFDDNDIRNLSLLQEIVHQALVGYWTQSAPIGGEASTKLHSQLEVALAQFGDSVLTNREAEVIRLYLKGHSSASISERLGITYHTVSTHRKSAYEKLDINSQGELFHLFIDSLTCYDPASPGDPLQGYLKAPR